MKLMDKSERSVLRDKVIFIIIWKIFSETMHLCSHLNSPRISNSTNKSIICSLISEV